MILAQAANDMTSWAQLPPQYLGLALLVWLLVYGIPNWMEKERTSKEKEHTETLLHLKEKDQLHREQYSELVRTNHQVCDSLKICVSELRDEIRGMSSRHNP